VGILVEKPLSFGEVVRLFPVLDPGLQGFCVEAVFEAHIFDRRREGSVVLEAVFQVFHQLQNVKDITVNRVW
jgi:hypothetical protein